MNCTEVSVRPSGLDRYDPLIAHRGYGLCSASSLQRPPVAALSPRVRRVAAPPPLQQRSLAFRRSDLVQRDLVLRSIFAIGRAGLRGSV